MLRKIGERLGLNRCPLHVLSEMKDKLVNALRGKVSDDVLAILEKGLSRFAPEKGDLNDFRVDLWDHLEVNYLDKKGDPEVLNKWGEALGGNITVSTALHENILGRDDNDRRNKNPDIWSADNILYGLKHMNFAVDTGMVSIYGDELCHKLPMKLARNLSRLFGVLNDWIAGMKDHLFNPVFHGAIDQLENDDYVYTSEVSSGSATEIHKGFHKWLIGKCCKAVTANVGLLGNDATKIALFDRVNFFIGPSQLNIRPFQKMNGIANAMRAGLDSAISIYVMLLLKISKEVPGNSDGSMSDEQKRVWGKSLQNFVVPSAKNSHAWAGHFFYTTNTRSNFGPDFSESTLEAFTRMGTEKEQYVAIQPEMKAVLMLYMMKLGLRRNACPALKSSEGKAPAMFRLADLIQKWYSENRVQGLIMESDKPA